MSVSANELKYDPQFPTYHVGQFTSMRSMFWGKSRVTVREQVSGSPGLLSQEMELGCQVSHPQLLLLMGFVPPGHGLGLRLVFEHVQLGSLYSCLHLQPPIQHLNSLVSKVDILLQITDGLQFLHSHGFVHCAVSSHAVQLVSGKVAKLGQMESMKIMNSVMDRPSGSDWLYLYNWLAPELLLRDRSVVWPSSDIYSLCCVMRELLTGDIPWADSLPADIVQNLIAGQRLQMDNDCIPRYLHRLLRIGLGGADTDLDLDEVRDMLVITRRETESISISHFNMSSPLKKFSVSALQTDIVKYLTTTFISDSSSDDESGKLLFNNPTQELKKLVKSQKKPDNSQCFSPKTSSNSIQFPSTFSRRKSCPQFGGIGRPTRENQLSVDRRQNHETFNKSKSRRTSDFEHLQKNNVGRSIEDKETWNISSSYSSNRNSKSVPNGEFLTLWQNTKVAPEPTVNPVDVDRFPGQGTVKRVVNMLEGLKLVKRDGQSSLSKEDESLSSHYKTADRGQETIQTGEFDSLTSDYKKGKIYRVNVETLPNQLRTIDRCQGTDYIDKVDSQSSRYMTAQEYQESVNSSKMDNLAKNLKKTDSGLKTVLNKQFPDFNRNSIGCQVSNDITADKLLGMRVNSHMSKSTQTDFWLESQPITPIINAPALRLSNKEVPVDSSFVEDNLGAYQPGLTSTPVNFTEQEGRQNLFMTALSEASRTNEEIPILEKTLSLREQFLTPQQEVGKRTQNVTFNSSVEEISAVSTVVGTDFTEQDTEDLYCDDELQPRVNLDPSLLLSQSGDQEPVKEDFKEESTSSDYVGLENTVADSNDLYETAVNVTEVPESGDWVCEGSEFNYSSDQHLAEEDETLAIGNDENCGEWEIGSKCVVKWEIDGCWYKATLVELKGGVAVVTFNDYGNTVECDLTLLRDADTKVGVYGQLEEVEW